MIPMLTQPMTVALLSVAFLATGLVAHTQLSNRPHRREQLVFVRYMGITTGLFGLLILPIARSAVPVVTSSPPGTTLGIVLVATLVGAGLWWSAYRSLVIRSPPTLSSDTGLWHEE